MSGEIFLFIFAVVGMFCHCIVFVASTVHCFVLTHVKFGWSHRFLHLLNVCAFDVSSACVRCRSWIMSSSSFHILWLLSLCP